MMNWSFTVPTASHCRVFVVVCTGSRNDRPLLRESPKFSSRLAVTICLSLMFHCRRVRLVAVRLLVRFCPLGSCDTVFAV